MLASACRPASASPEDAALDALRKRVENIRLDLDSVEVHQTKNMGDYVFVQITYQGLDVLGQMQVCETVEAVQPVSGGWSSTGGGSSCYTGPVPDEPASVSAGSFGSGNSGLSYVSGIVNDPEVASIEIVWGDGVVETVEIENESFLAVRQGQQDYRLVRVLDTSGGQLQVIRGGRDATK